MNIVKTDYREQLLESIRKIDTDGLPDEVEQVSSSKIVEEQKIYFWIRLYLKEQDLNVQAGDDIVITYKPNAYLSKEIKSDYTEELTTKFICYGKKGLEKDHDNEVVNYSNEDDTKILCLMVDERVVNFGQGIDFIRTLFKTGRHYEYQLVRRDELLFINKRNGIILDYYDCDF